MSLVQKLAALRLSPSSSFTSFAVPSAVTPELSILEYLIINNSHILEPKDVISFSQAYGEFELQKVWRYLYAENYGDAWSLFDQFFSWHEIFSSSAFSSGGDEIDWKSKLMSRLMSDQSESLDDLEQKYQENIQKAVKLMESLQRQETESMEVLVKVILDCLLECIDWMGPSPMVFYLLAELSFTLNGLEAAHSLVELCLALDPTFENALVLKDQLLELDAENEESVSVEQQQQNLLTSNGRLSPRLSQIIDEIFDEIVATRPTSARQQSGFLNRADFQRHLSRTSGSSPNAVDLSPAAFFQLTNGNNRISREHFHALYQAQTRSDEEETKSDIKCYGYDPVTLNRIEGNFSPAA